MQKSFFYGWVIVMAAAVIYAVTSVSNFCFGIFIKPMSEAFEWSRATVVLPQGLSVMVGIGLSVVSGRICDRRGPKLLMLAGGISLAIGFFICSQVTRLWHFYIGFSVCQGLGLACVMVPMTATISRWFVKSRGAALGIMYAGGGAGGLLLAPILQRVINNSGWQVAWLVLSVIAVLVTIPVTLLVKKEPADMGLLPLGAEQQVTKGGPRAIGAYEATRNFTLKEAVMSSQLWILSLGILLALAGTQGAQQNLVPYVTDKGIAPGTAALALGLAAGANAVGRIVMGFISDIIGTRQSMWITFLLATVAIFYLQFVDRTWMLIIFAILFGLVYGSEVPLNARAVAELFGTENMGAIMGFLMIFSTLGPAFGPFAIASIFDRTGNYSLAFIIAGGAMIVALILFMMLKLPKKGGVYQ